MPQKIRKTLLLAVLSCLAVAPVAQAQRRPETNNTQQILEYQVAVRQSLSSILYSLGIGVPGSPHRLYGRQGWIRKTMDLNPEITNWEALAPGTRLKIPVPARREATPALRAKAGNKPVTAAPAPATPATGHPTPPAVSAPKAPPVSKPAGAGPESPVRSAIPPPERVKGRSSVDVTSVQQSFGGGNLDITFDDDSRIIGKGVLVADTVRIGPYIMGEVGLIQMMGSQRYAPTEEDDKRVVATFRAYHGKGSIIIPFRNWELQLSGGLRKSNLNAPLRKEIPNDPAADEKKISNNRGESPLALVAGLGIRIFSDQGSYAEISGLAAYLKNGRSGVLTMQAAWMLLPTWFIGVDGRYEVLAVDTTKYHDATIASASLLLGFMISR